jgi:DNA-binding HxlR family transcriptional regulator
MKVSVPQHRKRAHVQAVASLRKGNLYSAACPSRDVLKHLTSRWGFLVLILLLDGTQRFSVLRRKVEGLSEKMLAQTLQDLEADGFVLRKAYPVIPPHVEYSLTEMGHEIAEQLRSLAGWIEENLPRITQARADTSLESIRDEACHG